MQIMLAILADTFSKASKNTNTLLLENTCVTLKNRRTKIFGNNLPFLRNAKGNLSALFTKMLFIQQKKPKLNTQSDSIKAKLFI